MKPLLIGLAGFSGAGKTTLAEHLEAQGGVKRFRFDAYYKNESECPKLEDGQPVWDIPQSVHLDEVYEALMDLREGNEILIPVYRRDLSRRVGSIVFPPSPVIFAEGLLLFSDDRIRNLFDLRLWLDVTEEVALSRRLQRQPDYDLDYYHNVAKPAAREHVLPLKGHAHEVLDGTQSIPTIVSCADAMIHQRFGL